MTSARLVITRLAFAVALLAASVAFAEQRQFATKFWGDDAGSSFDKNGKSWAGGDAITIALYVDADPSPWHSIGIEEQIATQLSRYGKIRIAVVTVEQDGPKQDFSFVRNTPTVLEHASQLGARYAVVLSAHSPRIETKKSLHVPLIFHMYQTHGIIDGELRIFDLTKNSQLTAEPFSVSKEGPRALQSTMDDDINDPDLHITAPQKLKFFEELEKETADYVTKRVRKLARGH